MSYGEMLKRFAEELKSKREEAQISLKQIAVRSKIDIKYLEAIEEGNFEILPDVYMRAFVKSYASALSMDPNAVIKRYELAKSGKMPADTHAEVSAPEDKEETVITQEKKIAFSSDYPNQEETETYKPVKNLNLIGGISAAAILIILIVIYFVFLKPSNNEILTESPYQELNSDKPARFEVPADNQNQATSADSLTLSVSARETSWIRYIIDGSFQKEVMMRPKESLVIRAKSNFNLLVGNSGGIEIVFNGKKIDSLGRKGEVKNININNEGITFPKINPDINER